jgi:glutathione synthase/RimK-type ligase-like ATP-grasp enzyme
MQEKIIIGILCSNLKHTDFYNTVNSLPINLIKFTVNGINWKDKKISGKILENGKWKQTVTRFPDAVYNRCYSSSEAVARSFEKVIGKGKVFNSFTRFNKYTIFSILEKSQLNYLMIPTHPYSTKVLLNMLNEGPVLIKPAKGTLGCNIFRFALEDNKYKVYSQTFHPMETFKTADELTSYLEKEINPKNYIIQPFISFASIDNHIFDMRMLVQKNHRGIWDVTADMGRVCFKNYFVTNLTYAIQPVGKILESTEFQHITISKLKQISIQVAKELEDNMCSLGEISADFGISSDGKLWIIEINGKPQKSIFCGIDNRILEKLVTTPLQYATYLAKL